MSQPPAGEFSRFHYWKNPDSEDIGRTATEFLKKLPGPTHIHVTGEDHTRCRAVTTLSHGNEPSGFHAVFEALRRQIRPVVDIHYFIPSVDAARQSPGFIYRMLPHQKDFNRCFKRPFGDSVQDRLAQDLVSRLEKHSPECVIDIHNTSGSSPSFGITICTDAKHDALVSLFTHRMIVTDLKLGALMEIGETMTPTVTIECGGAEDRESNLMATEGLMRYITIEDVLSINHTDMALEFFHNPLRLELLDGSDIAYGDHSLVEDGVTLLPDIENHNFGYVSPDNRLGYVSGELAANLTIVDIEGRERVPEYFRLEQGELYPVKRLKLFMVTTNPEIARKDCLFYLVEAG